MCNEQDTMRMFRGAEHHAHTVCPMCSVFPGIGEHTLLIRRPPICLGWRAYECYIALKHDITNYYKCLEVTDNGDSFIIKLK